MRNTTVEVDLSLARGLGYYTGTIYEVVLNGVNMGSVASGGRYDNLTESFGLKNVPGVGMSFGAERLYDVMEAENLFPADIDDNCAVLIVNINNELNKQYLSLAQKLRSQGIKCELYTQAAKIGKQLKFADKKGIKNALIAGDDEMANQTYQLKDLTTGNQQTVNFNELVATLK